MGIYTTYEHAILLDKPKARGSLTRTRQDVGIASFTEKRE
jgi:hypothetical protein